MGTARPTQVLGHIGLYSSLVARCEGVLGVSRQRLVSGALSRKFRRSGLVKRHTELQNAKAAFTKAALAAMKKRGETL